MKMLLGSALTAGALALSGVTISAMASSPDAPPAAPPVISALTKGPAVKLPAATNQVLDSVAAYGPVLEDARVITAPQGESWNVFPAANGGACAEIPDGTIFCGTGAAINSGLYGLIEVAEPAPAEAARRAALRRAQLKADPGRTTFTVKPSAPTSATRRGLVKDGIASVRALDASGTQIGTATVKNNAYVLNLGLEGQASSIQQLDASGTVVSTVAAY